jgi:hypothetical protein
VNSYARRSNPRAPPTDTPETETLEFAVAETPAERLRPPGEPEEPSEVANTIARMGLTRMSLQELKDKAPPTCWPSPSSSRSRT